MHGSSMQSPVKEELRRMTRVLIVIATLLIGGPSGRADEPTAPAWQSLAWRRIAASPLARTEAATAVVGGRLYLFGGFIAGLETSSQVDVYDPAADTWTAGPPLPEPRAGGGLAVAQGRLHYFGGFKPDRDTVCTDHWSLPLDKADGAWSRSWPPPRKSSAGSSSSSAAASASRFPSPPMHTSRRYRNDDWEGRRW
jgi:hypothetical protein